MLKLMRDNLKHLTWVLALVVLAFVFSVFADYGGQGSWFGGSGGNWAALVDGDEITVQEFLVAARNLDSYYRSLLGESYDAARFNLNIGQQALSQLVQNRVVLAHARSLGLTATPDEIRDAIVKNPNLQGDQGGFVGVERYKELLRTAGQDPSRFEDDLARQVLYRKWVEVVTADIVATDRQVEDEIRRRDERADLAFVQFRPADLGPDLEIADDELAAYFEENGEAYARGEGRSFQLLFFDRLREQREIVVPDEDLRPEYDASLETRFQVPEQRRASHILIKTPPEMTGNEISDAQARAQAALDRVRADEDFGSVAQEVSEDTSAANKGDLGFFGRGIMTPPFEQAVWDLSEIGDISGLVRTEFGFHVVKLTGEQAARRKPFEEVKEELQREVAFRMAGERVTELSQQFYDEVSVRPDAFEETAARQSRVLSETGPLFPGDSIPGVGPSLEVERALFAMTVGEISAPIAVSRGYVVARFLETHAGGTPPLEEIRGRVEADLRNDMAIRKADVLAREVTDAAAGKDLAALGEELSFEIEEVSQAARGSALGSLGIEPAVERIVFEGAVGAVAGPIATDRGPVVLEVRDRQEVGVDEIAERAPQIREQLMETRRQLAIAAMTRQLVEAADIRTNQQVIQAIDAPATAPATAPASS